MPELNYESLELLHQRYKTLSAQLKISGEQFTGKCEGFYGECGSAEVSVVNCRTAYADNKQNTSPTLCKDCAQEYNDHWDDMWAEYYGSRF